MCLYMSLILHTDMCICTYNIYIYMSQMQHMYVYVSNTQMCIYIRICSNIFFMFLIYISATPNHSIKGSKARVELLATC